MIMKAEMPSEMTRSRTHPASTGARTPVGLAGGSVRGAISGADMYSLILYGVGQRRARLLGASGDRVIADREIGPSGDRVILTSNALQVPVECGSRRGEIGSSGDRVILTSNALQVPVECGS